MAETTFPAESVLRSDPVSVEMARPPVVIRTPPKVEVAEVSRRVSAMPFEKVEVPAPWTIKFPVVVAPPKMVRPVACVPAPMVDEAKAVRPPLNERSVVVAFEGKRYAKVGRPSEEVLVSAYEPFACPTRI